MDNLRPNGQRAKNAIILLWILIAFEVISFISGYFQYDLLRKVAQGAEISEATANANDTRERVIGIINLLFFIISGVTFIQWFRRAYYNLHQKVSGLSYSESWAAGGWFVPLFNLFAPYKIMKEMYQETGKLFSEKGIDIRAYYTENILGIWWAFWIVNGFLNQFMLRYTVSADSVDEFIDSTLTGMVSNIIGIPLALLAIRVIKDYSNAEPVLFALDENPEIPAVNSFNVYPDTEEGLSQGE